jgi:hypothetical protein
LSGWTASWHDRHPPTVLVGLALEVVRAFGTWALGHRRKLSPFVAARNDRLDVYELVTAAMLTVVGAEEIDDIELHRMPLAIFGR